MRRSVLCLGSLTFTSALAVAQTTTRENVGPLGAQANNTSSNGYVLSADGWYVAFASAASNMVAGDTNGAEDIFVRDRRGAVTERVSISTGGAQSTGSTNSDNPTISGDGRYVAFESTSTTFVAGDTNGTRDIFLRDRQAGTTTRVSVDSSGAQSNGDSERPSLTSDGRFIAFMSTADNLVAGDTNGTMDVFVRDLMSGTTERVSLGSGGVEALGFSSWNDLSDDGRFVSFTSTAANLVAGDTNGIEDVFVRDRLLGTTELVSVDASNGPSDGLSTLPTISANGRFVAFYATATDLVANDANGAGDVFVRDRQLGVTTRMSIDFAGGDSNGQSASPSISADGRFVAFWSAANDLITGDTNGAGDVFVRDRALPSTQRLSVSTGLAQGSTSSGFPSLSASGRRVLFQSYANNLVMGDTNMLPDLFVRDTLNSGVPFCAGDGSATVCPCGNSGAANSGCAASAGNGARLNAIGSPSLGVDQVLLFGEGLPSGLALYIQGTTRANGGLGVTFGDGLRCVAGSVVRLGQSFGSVGESQFPDTQHPPLAVAGQVTTPGTRVYQIWYRNAAAFCTSDTFNLSNGWELVWEP